ncbi:MAG: hypothetical protein JW797_20365 [Bradymonadales bacterium]|nr:hypothetical protein [Bradymonadales bacterium]
MNVPVSPSRTEERDAEDVIAGTQLGFELGYGFNDRWRLLADFRLSFLEQETTHSVGIALLAERRIIDNLALRWGLGYRDVAMDATVTAETTAGPGRTAEIEWTRPLRGDALTIQGGLGYQIPLADFLAFTTTLDIVVGVLPLHDTDALRFDDALNVDLQLGAGLRWHI